jgi:endonuclease III
MTNRGGAQFAKKLRKCAQIALEEFDGDLRPVLKLPFPKAKKALQKFPGIGEPGAEKILLFSRTYPALALESNGLRVLLRLGFGEEKKSYSTTYRLVQRAADEGLDKGCSWLIEAHLLLRRHGQELCKNSKPECRKCPLAPDCDFYQRGAPMRRTSTTRTWTCASSTAGRSFTTVGAISRGRSFWPRRCTRGRWRVS